MSTSKMKRMLSILVISVLTVSIVCGSQVAAGAAVKVGVSKPTGQTTMVGTVTASVLNVRSSYSANAGIIGTLAKGANAYILSAYQGWYKITFNRTTGWVSGTYLANIHAVTTVSASSSSKSSSTTVSAGASSAVSAGSSSIVSSGNNTISSGTSSTATSTSSVSPAVASAASSSTSSATSSTVSVPVSSLPVRAMIGYYASWSAYSGFTPDKIKASMMNVVNYAFASVWTDLKIAVGDSSIDYTNFSKLNALKASYPNLKTVISIGGWDGSARFSDAALTDASRKAFAQSCVSFIKQYGFDGVDIDWEYPVSGGCPGRPEDKTNFTLLMQALRTALNHQAIADGKYYYLSFAGGASGGYISNVQLSQLANYVDFAVDMTYDLHGPWDAYADFNAPLYTPTEASPQYKVSVDSSIRAWVSAGFPSSKLVMGIPFYGYMYSGAGAANNGLYQPFTGAKSISYDSIVASYLSSPAFTTFYYSVAQVNYLYGNNTFISYDNAASITKKAQYSAANGLRGVSAWELSQDKTSTLLTAAYNGLR